MSENDIGYSLQEPGWGVPVATKPTIPGVNVKIKKVFPFRSTAPQHQFFQLFCYWYGKSTRYIVYWCVIVKVIPNYRDGPTGAGLHTFLTAMAKLKCALGRSTWRYFLCTAADPVGSELFCCYRFCIYVWYCYYCYYLTKKFR